MGLLRSLMPNISEFKSVLCSLPPTYKMYQRTEEDPLASGIFPHMDQSMPQQESSAWHKHHIPLRVYWRRITQLRVEVTSEEGITGSYVCGQVFRVCDGGTQSLDQ